MAHERPDPVLGLSAGAEAGLVAWVVVQIVMVVITLAAGPDLWMGPRRAGAPYLVPRSMQPGFDSWMVPIGVLCHIGIAVGWGALFSALFCGLSAAPTIAAGVAWGLVAWRLMYDFVYPALGVVPVLAWAPIGVAGGLHVLYGVALALMLLALERRRDGNSSPSIEARSSRRRDTAA
jgi:hypothetical protein